MSPPVSLHHSQKGRSFAVLAKLLARGGEGGLPQSLRSSELLMGDLHPVTQYFRSAVSAGSMTAASALAVAKPLFSEFIEFITPMTILGRLVGAHHVPLNVRIARTLSTASFSWVAESGTTPASSMTFDAFTLPPLKVGGIVAISRELLRSTSANADTVIRNELAAGLVAALDRQFIDPQQTGVPGTSPASISSGGVSVTCTGTTAAAARSDLVQLLENVIAVTNFLAPTWVMTRATAARLSLLDSSNQFNQKITPAGGYLANVPVLISNSVPSGNSPDSSSIVLLDASEVLLGDDGGLELDLSTQADIELQSAPSSPATSANVMTSLWQADLAGFKVMRTINWTGRRPVVAGYISSAAYRE